MPWQAAESRYEGAAYRRCGQSGVQLPAVSLGLWHNFGESDRFERGQQMVRHAFDHGITHFDLANNYGPPPGSAERAFGEMLRQGLGAHRDELLISSKAGYLMWPGPYGEWGSRKQLIASADQSLKRLGLPYVDIFYHHRPDPNTPLEETMRALDHIVRSGRALYVGLSNYPADRLREAAAILQSLGTPCLIHQARYSLLDRHIEAEVLAAQADAGMGCIAFSPLAQGLLTHKYLSGSVPADSRAAGASVFLKASDITPERVATLNALHTIAEARGQTLSQMALAWVLRHAGMSSVLIGASHTGQIDQALAAVRGGGFTADTLSAIDAAVRA